MPIPDWSNRGSFFVFLGNVSWYSRARREQTVHFFFKALEKSLPVPKLPLFYFFCWAHVLMLRMCVHYKLYLWLAAHVWDCAKRMFNGTRYSAPSTARPTLFRIIFFRVCVCFFSFVRLVIIYLNLDSFSRTWQFDWCVRSVEIFVSPTLDSVRQYESTK